MPLRRASDRLDHSCPLESCLDLLEVPRICAVRVPRFWLGFAVERAGIHMSRRLVAAAFAAAVVLTTGTAGAATKQISDFTGAASSHAVRISIGNISLTVGGGES